VKVNTLEAKSQLSKLVKQALEGEDVVIASNGEPMVRLVPIARKARLRGWGKLQRLGRAVDVAFTPEVDAEIASMLERRS
jgi:prevent-host-death family protein